eukprot:2772332-Pleurochrysis_carterae.AAC.6
MRQNAPERKHAQARARVAPIERPYEEAKRLIRSGIERRSRESNESDASVKAQIGRVALARPPRVVSLLTFHGYEISSQFLRTWDERTLPTGTLTRAYEITYQRPTTRVYARAARRAARHAAVQVQRAADHVRDGESRRIPDGALAHLDPLAMPRRRRGAQARIAQPFENSRGNVARGKRGERARESMFRLRGKIAREECAGREERGETLRLKICP